MASKELIEYFEASLEWDDSGQKKETSFDYREFKHCEIPYLRFVFHKRDTGVKHNWYLDYAFNMAADSSNWVLINPGGENMGNQSIECFLKSIMCKKLLSKFKHLIGESDGS
jgi:hypothetical protein